MAQPRENSQDYVQAQGKLVIQVSKERRAAKEWEGKWGFLKDKRRYLEEEAEKYGMTKEEYWNNIKSLRPKYVPYIPPTTPKPTYASFPVTSSAMVGWRADQPLEKREAPIIPPPPKDPPQYNIFLG